MCPVKPIIKAYAKKAIPQGSPLVKMLISLFFMQINWVGFAKTLQYKKNVKMRLGYKRWKLTRVNSGVAGNVRTPAGLRPLALDPQGGVIIYRNFLL